MSKIPIETWWLPRNYSKQESNGFKGMFPQHLETRLFRMYKERPILQPFGGKARQGVIMDINRRLCPMMVGDAHNLPFKDATFGLVLCDPPYSDDLSRTLYGTGKIDEKRYIKEAIRVLKEDGILILYHRRLFYLPDGFERDRIIVLLHQINHEPRVINVFRREKLFQKKLC